MLSILGKVDLCSPPFNICSPLNLKIVLLLTIGFTLASLLGYLSFKIKLSPLLGYLVAGYLIGPYSPGYEADKAVAEQLAEIGVILMMFGVGLHIKGKELLEQKKIALPGAFGQTLSATLLVMLLAYFFGWSWIQGIIFGLAIGVASTVVLMRQLQEEKLLGTPQGHIAVAWLIVEDWITVLVLLLVPSMGLLWQGKNLSLSEVSFSIVVALAKFILMGLILFTVGHKIIKYIFSKISHTHTHSGELFTLTILAVTFLIATGGAVFFGISITLGAFLAGMLIGQTDVRHLVSNHTRPIKDVFIVLFFLSIGMLFNPVVIAQHWLFFFAILAVILIIKPLAAYTIVRVLRYPTEVALTVAVALAQIGEFSFILAEEASRVGILPRLGYDLIVASALISIALNPILFKRVRKLF